MTFPLLVLFHHLYAPQASTLLGLAHLLLPMIVQVEMLAGSLVSQQSCQCHFFPPKAARLPTMGAWCQAVASGGGMT